MKKFHRWKKHFSPVIFGILYELKFWINIII